MLFLFSIGRCGCWCSCLCGCPPLRQAISTLHFVETMHQNENACLNSKCMAQCNLLKLFLKLFKTKTRNQNIGKLGSDTTLTRPNPDLILDSLTGGHAGHPNGLLLNSPHQAKRSRGANPFFFFFKTLSLCLI